jgi:serine/threonine-protein kinase
MSEEAVLALPEGSTFQGRYTIGRRIKAGGMGAVYEVVHLETRRRRALKVMLPSLVRDSDMRARFKLEATVTADVESQHIVETFDAGVDAETGAPFLVMELLKGEDLAEVLKKRGRLPAQEALELLSQTAMALDRTHDAGIIHRDLKPENLFIARRDDGSPFLKVLDFGVAKLVAQSSQSIKTTRSLGTPLYMSPEQIEGSGAIDHRADLYALAHIAYTLLVGEAYWAPESRNKDSVYPIILKVMQGIQEPASARAARLGVTLPPAFDAWFVKGVAPAREDRFDTASDLVNELAVALGETPLGLRVATHLSAAVDQEPRAGGGTPPRSTARVAGALAVIAAAALVVTWLRAPKTAVEASAGPSPPAPSACASPASSPSPALPEAVAPKEPAPDNAIDAPARAPTAPSPARTSPKAPGSAPTAAPRAKPNPAPTSSDPTDVR